MNTEQKIKQAVTNTSKKICGEVCTGLGMTIDSNASDLIAEMVYKKLCLYAEDLEAFQKHARRSQVTVDDVKLLVRRNDSLADFVQRKAQIIAENKPAEVAAAGGGKRKRKATNSAG
ncbi:centromere protein S-like [Cylas formicarius]|uniref:centromere protein S-like n=1 Tax=Cylas formicarius TaxID=197179 RepID=UPI0029585C32|nr:centromere protein S-like [Cylas formicarius]